MPRRKAGEETSDKYELPPMLSEEAIENLCVAESYKLVYQRIKDGSASAQEVCHFLKLGSQKSRLELNMMTKQSELISAKTEAINQAEDYRKIAAEAMAAMTEYRGGNTYAE